MLDHDGDGSVSMQELCQVTMAAFPPSSPCEFAMMMTMIMMMMVIMMITMLLVVRGNGGGGRECGSRIAGGVGSRS